MPKEFETTAVFDCRTRRIKSVEYRAPKGGGLMFNAKFRTWYGFGGGKTLQLIELEPKQVLEILRATADAAEMGGGIVGPMFGGRSK